MEKPVSNPDTLQLRMEFQRNAVADEVEALTAVVRPILTATLYSLKGEIVKEAGGHANVSLKMLARVYRPGDGDCGICFEYAVHDALNRQDPIVLERVSDALQRYCRISGGSPSSILFGAEKSGALKLIDTVNERLTDDSSVLPGTAGRPVKLKRYVNTLAAALRKPSSRTGLPYSISGLWKADLFLGHTDSDRWVGTTVKVNPTQLEPARGLRVGIVPSAQGRSDNIYKDEPKNLVVCPMPYDGSFMQTFYEGLGIVRQFFAADAKVPSDAALPRPSWRQVARSLADRRDYPVLEVVDVLAVQSQPELLDTIVRDANLISRREEEFKIGALIVPQARRTDQ